MAPPLVVIRPALMQVTPAVIFLLLLFLLSLPLTRSFPLRHLGRVRNASRMGEDQEPVLCWTVHINTRSDCDAAAGGDDVDDGMGSQKPQGRRRCARSAWAVAHAKALARELNLEVLYAFGEFYDHYVLCYTFSNQWEGNAAKDCLIPPSLSSSRTMAPIHFQHSELKRLDTAKFLHLQKYLEQLLSTHEEVLLFSAEHVHSRVSRSRIADFSESLKSRSEVINPSPSVLQPLNQITNEPSNVKGEKHFTRAFHGRPMHALSAHTFLKNISRVHGQKENIFNFFISKTSLLYNSTETRGTSPASGYASVPRVRLLQSNTETQIESPNISLQLSSITSPGIPENVTIKASTYSSSSRENPLYFISKGAIKTEARPVGDLHSHSGKNYPPHHHKIRRRSMNLAFNDPAFSQQWHLVNYALSGMDINVKGVWEHGYAGQGVTVAVVDDGIEWRNPDLKANYNSEASWDMNDDDPDPSPNPDKSSNHHGTRCAGEIAAVANNRVCGLGVAYLARISGLRVLDGVMTDSLEAEAFNKKMDINDIYSCSWGPDDDGKTVDGPHLMAAKAMKHGIDFGRGGYGSIYVVASGNGGENKDNCNFDGYANSIYTVTIGAVDEEGEMPYYGEECASMLGVTFSSGTWNKRDIVTTDWTVGNAKGCTEKHTGTSAAAPLAAAMIALMLHARPCLSWRDVQYIMIMTAKKVDVRLAHWQKNGAGLSHSHMHGFGLLDAWRLVNAARVWKTVPWLTSFSHLESDLNIQIPKGVGNPLRIHHIVTDVDIRGLSLFTLENIQLSVWLSHPYRGKLGVKLVSPVGTVSVLATPRPKDNSSKGFTDWTFTTVRCWGEKPTGNWTMIFTDHDDGTYGSGWVTQWRLILFGTPMTSEEFAQRRVLIESAMSGEYLQANHTLPCPPPPQVEEVYEPMSQKTLKILVLFGAFCLVMAIYESAEYLLCYNDEKKEQARRTRLLLRAMKNTNEAQDHSNGGADFGASSPAGVRTGSVIDQSNQAFSERQNVEDDDEEEEDDLFDMSETVRLLRPVQHNTRSADSNRAVESIPLSTFRTVTGPEDLESPTLGAAAAATAAVLDTSTPAK